MSTMQVVAYLVHKGRAYVNRAFISESGAQHSIEQRQDGAVVGRLVLEADALAAIKAAQEDARRLDWIARQDLDDIVFGVVVDAPHDGEYIVNAGRGPFYGKTFRAAIDAAMEKAR